MFSSRFRSSLPLAVAAVALLIFAGAAAATNVTYTAGGQFSKTVLSGTDTFKLAGQPFTISIVAPTTAVPFKTGTGYAEYKNLQMTGQVMSGLVPTPITISTNAAQIELSYANPNYDLFALFAPVKVLGLTFNITASIHAPTGTITNYNIGLFTAPVTLNVHNSYVTYATTTNGTTGLTVAGGKLSTKSSAQGPTAELRSPSMNVFAAIVPFLAKPFYTDAQPLA